MSRHRDVRSMNYADGMCVTFFEVKLKNVHHFQVKDVFDILVAQNLRKNITLGILR